MTDKLILKLGNSLERAVKEGDWEEVRLLDTHVGQLLTKIRQRGEQETLREDLILLLDSHRRARQLFTQKLDALGRKIQQYQKKREGLQAYAMFTPQQKDTL